MIVPASIVIDGGSPALRFNIPKTIAISGRTISIEWISRAYAKEPDKMWECFILWVVRELLRTVSFKRASEYRKLVSEYRKLVADTISRGLTPFLKQYAHLMFNQDAAYPYKTLATLPDEVEIDGRLWMMDRFKRPDVSSKSAISGLIAEVAEIYLSTEPLISLDYFELRSLASTFAAKFCTFIELNVGALFGEKHRLADDNDSIRAKVADQQTQLDALCLKSIYKNDECASLKSESKKLKRKLEELNDLNSRLREEIESLQASLSVKPTFSDLHAISVQNDSLHSQVAVLRAESYALKSKLSLSPTEDEREHLRKVNKDLNEANTSISNELRILKKTVAILMKENTDLEDQLKCKGGTP